MKELQRMREEWTAIVAHDLRQPLNVITTYVDMLRSMGASPDTARLFKGLEQTKKAATRLNRMISDLTDISQIESRHLHLKREATDVGALVREVVERHRVISPSRVIEVRVGGPAAKVDVDPFRIEQVLGNVLVNALKYSDPGTEVVVEVRHEETAVRVLVTNRGPDIPAEEAPKLFQRYFRAARSRTGGDGGLGLGLYIAKGLVQAHGGRISVQSLHGVTTFQIALPLMKEEVLH